MAERVSVIRQEAMRSIAWILALGLVGVVAAGCSSQPAGTATSLWQGDTLHGRVAADTGSQSFAFEGVESSMLDFRLSGNACNETAPDVRLTDPEGRPVDLSASTVSAPGDASVRVKDQVLVKTGTYKVTVLRHPQQSGGMYTFNHEIRYVPPVDTTTHLSPAAPRPVYVAAPRGGMVAFTITPGKCSDLQPDIVAVKDPWGGPALDVSQVPCGCQPPRVSHGCDRSMTLTFVAPRPGMYTILAASKPGGEGVGKLHVEVMRPRWRPRTLYHNDAPAGAYGFPGHVPPDARPPSEPPTTAALPARPVVSTPVSPAPVSPVAPVPAPAQDWLPAPAPSSSPAPAAGSVFPPPAPAIPPIAQR